MAASLAQVIPAAGLEVDRFFPVAIAIVERLHAMHRRGLVVLDLRPATIGHDVATGAVTLPDGYDPPTGDVLGSPAIDALPYVSPEQSGRIAARPDHRSDLYALGATFFE